MEIGKDINIAITITNIMFILEHCKGDRALAHRRANKYTGGPWAITVTMIIGCTCANSTSKSLISASFGQRPEARGQRPEAREGTKDYKRSCKERINQIFPHHHTVFLMKM